MTQVSDSRDTPFHKLPTDNIFICVKELNEIFFTSFMKIFPHHYFINTKNYFTFKTYTKGMWIFGYIGLVSIRPVLFQLQISLDLDEVPQAGCLHVNW